MRRNTLEKKTMVEGNVCFFLHWGKEALPTSCVRNPVSCLKPFTARTLIFIYHPNSSSSILIAPVRKNKKWKHFVQLHHGKPVSDQQKREDEMMPMVVIIHILTSTGSSPVGAARNRSALTPCPQEVSRRLLSAGQRGTGPGWLQQPVLRQL